MLGFSRVEMVEDRKDLSESTLKQGNFGSAVWKLNDIYGEWIIQTSQHFQELQEGEVLDHWCYHVKFPGTCTGVALQMEATSNQ